MESFCQRILGVILDIKIFLSGGTFDINNGGSKTARFRTDGWPIDATPRTGRHLNKRVMNFAIDNVLQRRQAIFHARDSDIFIVGIVLDHRRQDTTFDRE